MAIEPRVRKSAEERREEILAVAIRHFAIGGLLATSDADIRAHVRSNYEHLVSEVTELSGADPGSVWSFFAQGMLLNVTQSLDLQAIAGESEWAASWCNGPPGDLTHPSD